MKKYIIIILLFLLAGCSGGGGDDIFTQLISNDECTGHGGIHHTRMVTEPCPDGGTFCNDGTCQD